MKELKTPVPVFEAEAQGFKNNTVLTIAQSKSGRLT